MKKRKTPFRKFISAVYSMRGALLSLPVAALTVILAVHNYSVLKPSVGIFLQESGTYFLTVPRTVAIAVPIIITACCMIVTCLSKKVFYPWLISLFTLVIPLLLWVLTIFGI